MSKCQQNASQSGQEIMQPIVINGELFTVYT